MNTNNIEYAKDTFNTEIKALEFVRDNLGLEFDKAINLMLNTSSYNVIMGVGKSGIIGEKISATLSSTGTPSIFIHPTDAYHGNLGMINPDDTIILISYSGETEEVLNLLPSIKHFKNKTIAITGNLNSTLSKSCDVTLNIKVEREACPYNLAPTASVVATLAMGDALAMNLMKLKKFKPINFAKFHPGGSLGRKLLTKVHESMTIKMPLVNLNTNFYQCIETMNSYKLGLTLVTKSNKLIGIITDGDIRRAINKHLDDSKHLTAQDIMNKTPKTIPQDLSIYEAEEIMKLHSIHAIIAVDKNQNPVGILEFS